MRPGHATEPDMIYLTAAFAIIALSTAVNAHRRVEQLEDILARHGLLHDS